jgi:hypothetical protein
MKRKPWAIYWACMLFITILIQSFHLFNFVTQPTLGEYYTGKTVVYAAYVFGLAGIIFFIATIYTFLVSLKTKNLSLWVYNFLACLLYFFISEVFFNAIAERFFPLNVWEQSTLEKLQPKR